VRGGRERERNGDLARDHEEGEEVAPHEGIEGVAGAVEGAVFGRDGAEFDEALDDGDGGADAEEGGWDGEDWGCVR
jgi:hypothetical protein